MTNSLLFFFSMLLVASQGVGFQKQSEEAEPFQWLISTGETAGVSYITHRVSQISLQTESGPPVEIKTDETRVNSQTTRIIRKSFSRSANGARLLSETTVEEINRLPGDRVRAVRTVSQPDANGRLRVIRQETQEIAKTGADIYRITKTVSLSGSNSVLEEKEQVTQVEKRSGEKSIDIDRVRYIPSANGTWDLAERRVSRNIVDKEETQTDEDVYSSDVNNGVSISQKLKILELQDETGRINRRSESYASGNGGILRLNRRLTIVQTPLTNGRQQTIQTIETRSPVAANENLRLVQKVIENLQANGANETKRQVQVLEPDLNGGMRTIENWQSIELK